MRVAYTDGSCSDNPGGVGAWGYALFEKGEIIEIKSGVRDSTTSNRMELEAILMALKNTDADQIYSDSLYAINCITGKWKSKKNIDLIEEALNLAAKKKVAIDWVKGHSGVDGNEIADELCESAMQKRYYELHGKVYVHRYRRKS